MARCVAPILVQGQAAVAGSDVDVACAILCPFLRAPKYSFLSNSRLALIVDVFPLKAGLSVCAWFAGCVGGCCTIGRRIKQVVATSGMTLSGS